MNYIGEINAFEKWLEQCPLELAPQLLMYKFYKLANKAGWPEWVSVDNLTLMVEMKTKREATVIGWRDKLINTGLIEYRKGKKGSPNRYKITSLYQTNTTITEAQSVAQPVAQSVVKTAVSYKHKTKTETNNPHTPKKQIDAELLADFSESARDAIISWTAYKSEKRQEYKPEGFKKLLSQIKNNIDKYGDTAVIEVIEQSMAANYAGIIFDKLKNKPILSADAPKNGDRRADGRIYLDGKWVMA